MYVGKKCYINITTGSVKIKRFEARPVGWVSFKFSRFSLTRELQVLIHHLSAEAFKAFRVTER